MIKAVIFDFGNVVHSLENYNPRQDIADAYKLTIDQVTDISKPLIEELGLGKIDEETFWKELSKDLNVDVPENYEEVFRKIRNHMKLYQQVIDLVQDLKTKGFQTIVLSNTNQPHEDVITDLGWYLYFDKVYLSHKVGLRKPDTKIYELVLKENNLKGEECIYIDDLEENLSPARELRIATILAKDENQIVVDLKQIINI